MALFEFSKRLKKWQQVLDGTPGWQDALHSALDHVGFTAAHVSNVNARKKLWPNRRKAVKDNIWGMIEFSRDDGEIIDSPIMQRMRSIRQNGLTYLTYPNANHTRFEHSLGVFEVVGRLLDSSILTTEAFLKEREGGVTVSDNLEPVNYPRNSREYRLIRHAALLHDVGHAPFSHVSEKVFKTLGSDLKIGPMTVKKFTDTFRLEYSLPLGDDDHPNEVGARSRGKSLSEILSVAILLSERFRDFYTAVCHNDHTFDEESDIYDLCSLILGDRISQNDFALPEVLSGPVDADKIDYLVRDSRACGINVGIDVARVFLRAGVYQAPPKVANSLGLELVDQRNKVKIFLIDPSGSDAVRELGTSRLSLYDRVYYHQYTRKAEQELLKVFKACAVSDAQEVAPFRCLLSTWSVSEDFLLDSLCISSDWRVANGSRRIKSRIMPKRIAMLSREFLVDPLFPCTEFSKQFEKETDECFERLFHAVDKNSLFAEDGETSKLASTFFREASKHLSEVGGVSTEEFLPTEPPIGFIAPPKQVDADPKPALILMNDSVVRFGEDESSRLFAGAVRLNKGIVTAPDGARETALLALEKSLFLNQIETEFEVSPPSSDISAVTGNSSLVIKGQVSPRLDIPVMLRQFKLNGDRLREYRQHLLGNGFYDGIPHLIPFEDDEKVKQIAEKFTTFQGEHGWVVNQIHVRKFLEQFPIELRGQVSNILLNDFFYMDRSVVVSGARKAIQKVATSGKWFASPLSLSSGMQIRTSVRDSISIENVTFVSSPTEAVDRAAAESGNVLIFDDNIASGTQAKRQMSILFGLEDAPDEKNYFSDHFNAAQKAFLKNNGLSFSFASAYQGGISELKDFLCAQGLTKETVNVSFDKPLEETSLTGKLSPELTDFLKKVGHQVLGQRFEQEGKSDPYDEAEPHALGYSGLQSAYAHFLNVPTTTITALWCPGMVLNTVCYSLHETREVKIPWLPLLLRSKHAKYLVLGI